MADHGTTISIEPDDDEFDPPPIEGTLLWAVTEIRRRTVGGKPDLADLPDAVDAYIRQVRATAVLAAVRNPPHAVIEAGARTMWEAEYDGDFNADSVSDFERSVFRAAWLASLRAALDAENA